jgi:hypothetical protein
MKIRQLGALLAAATLFAFVPTTAVEAADPVPPFITPDAPWLNTVNYYRAMAGQPAVTENTSLSSGAYNHSCYMLYNGISHDEVVGYPGYTSSGDTAGNNGNVAVSTAYGTSARNHIELWMTGPFHAIGVLRHNLPTVGFGKCDLQDTPKWHSGATLNVLSGLVTAPRPTTPILFPGNGTTTNLNQFIAETPNPVTACGWTGGAGLPVIAMMPEPVTTVSASMTGPNGPVQTCRLFAGNTTGTAKSILGGDNAVTVVPRAALSPGVYTVTVTTQARTVTWSFTVDPAAATGVMPIPNVTTAAPPSGYSPVTPFRFADSRISHRITKLLAGVPKKIKVAGVAGIPSDASAVSANFTVVKPNGSTWLTVYNCAATVPTASTLNFGTGDIVANAGVFPLSSAGELCVVSPSQTDLVIDITGHFRPSVTTSFVAQRPTPLVDTTTGLRSSGRLASGQTLRVDVVDAGIGVPSNATAVALNITGVTPAIHSFITSHSCDTPLPNVSSVNPLPNTTRQNFAIVPMSASGELCFFAFSAMHMKVDVLGYFTDGGAGKIVPTSPTRVTDTRDKYRNAMNLGTSGGTLQANQVYTLQLGGQRGIPSTAKAVSLNVTVAYPVGSGTVTVWGCGSEPNVDSVTFSTSKNIANGAQVALSSNGSICLSSTNRTHLVIDVTGWWN